MVTGQVCGSTLASGRIGGQGTMVKDEPNHSSNYEPLNWACISDRGRVREENEDAYRVDAEHSLFIVSDGMGGHAEGARASQIVVEDLPSILIGKLEKLKNGSSTSIRQVIYKSIIELNQNVRKEGTSGDGHRNMGATLVMAMQRSNRLYIANVGDSRAYLLRNNRLKRLTVDHTFVAELLEQGQIESDETVNHPQQHIITQCVGIDADVNPLVRSIAPRKNDRLLLCSDGLTAVVPDDRIKNILQNHTAPVEACIELVSAANAAGSPDNTTVMAVNIN